MNFEGNKRQKLDTTKCSLHIESSTSLGVAVHSQCTSSVTDDCTHPGAYGGLCIRCGGKVDDDSGVALAYIHKTLWVSSQEIARLRDKDMRNLLRHKKIYLVLDLDHTLLNSSPLDDINGDEEYLKGPKDDLPKRIKTSLHRVESMQRMTKLRPFVHTFLKAASKMFEMYIYTMGSRNYAREMAKLLDPEDVYFNSRVISRSDGTQMHRKGLDVVLAKANAVLILDDTEHVWEAHPENLILMRRYHYFASSLRSFNLDSHRSRSQSKRDEKNKGGHLASVLQLLKMIHGSFFDTDNMESLVNKDVRLILKNVRDQVLKGCKLHLVFPEESQAYNQHYRELAVQMGATWTTELDQSITHVVSKDSETEKSRWAVQEKKFLVNPRWIDDARYLWQKQPEEKFPVSKAT